jgi:acyl-coenzyme A synthetase/AMP-(fatty) acid ligase
MMMAGPLSNLFQTGRPDAMPIAESGGEAIGFARFQADVAANAARIAATGCRRGLLATRDAYWGAVGLFALMLAGAEVVMPHNLQPGSLEGLRDAWDWIVQDRALEDIGPALVLEPAGGHLVRHLGPVNPDALLSFFTSGSTGTPKRIMKRFGMLEREAAAIEELLGPAVPADAVVHATVNHQHVYGLAFRLCWPLATGRCFSNDMLELWESVLLRLDDRSVLVTSPAHLERLGGLRPLPMPRHPALLLSAGAPLSDAAARDAAAIFGTQVLEIFGSTETGATAFRRRGHDGCPWRALPGVKVERAEDGRMRVISPYAVDGGVFVGADLVEVETDGGLRFQGRTDRVVKIEGKRVELTAVENDLRRLPLVGEAVATGLDTGQRTPCLAAAVVPSSAGAALLAEIGPFRFGRRLRRDLAATQEPAGLPRRWAFVDQLPTGPLGKRNHAGIEALFK